jgi:hypothetical protein
MLAQSEYAAKQSQQAAEQNENTKHTPDVRTKVSHSLLLHNHANYECFQALTTCFNVQCMYVLNILLL